MIIVKHYFIIFHWQWKINQVDSGLGSFSPLLPSKRAWQVTAMVDMDSPLQDPTSYTSDRQTRSRDAWLDQVLHCSCGCCGCLARHDKMIWMIHYSRIFKNHQLLKGTLRWIPKDGSPNHKDPKWYIHRYLATQTKRWRSAKVSSDMGGASALFPSVLAMMRENLNVIFWGLLDYLTKPPRVTNRWVGVGLSRPTIFRAICWFPCVQVYGIPKA